jgi:exodeoxyribonuclease VII large subunit
MQLEQEQLLGLSNEMVPELRVKDLAGAIKSLLEGRFCNVRVRGEISGLKVATSGHIYFSLKDEDAVLKAICWKSLAMRIPFKLEEGMEVVCSGSISTYPGGSYYQIIPNKVELAGLGALLATLQARKKKFEQEGLFSPMHKKKIPFLPTKIGIVTSPTGAVIRDIMHRIEARFPVEVLLWGVLVQGNGAAQQIANAIRGFNCLPANITKPDLLIVARGGGSVEDLWAFNEEDVVRAVADSSIPVISAVGHETDTTLIDYVADLRAPTPTAAAEMAVPVLSELQYTLQMHDDRLRVAIPNMLKRRELMLARCQEKLMDFTQKLSVISNRVEQFGMQIGFYLQSLYRHKQHAFSVLQSRMQPRLLLQKVTDATQYMTRSAERLHPTVLSFQQMLHSKLLMEGKLLDNLDYKNTLKRGFALVRSGDRKIVRSADNLVNNVSIEMHDGIKQAIITDSSMPAKRQVRKKSALPDQGSLFDF